MVRITLRISLVFHIFLSFSFECSSLFRPSSIPTLSQYLTLVYVCLLIVYFSIYGPLFSSPAVSHRLRHLPILRRSFGRDNRSVELKAQALYYLCPRVIVGDVRAPILFLISGDLLLYFLYFCFRWKGKLYFCDWTRYRMRLGCVLNRGFY